MVHFASVLSRFILRFFCTCVVALTYLHQVLHHRLHLEAGPAPIGPPGALPAHRLVPVGRLEIGVAAVHVVAVTKEDPAALD